MDILYLIEDAVGQPDVPARVSFLLEHLLADLSELEFGADFLEDIAYHEFDAFADEVEVVVFVEFVAAVEDAVDCLHVLSRVADLVSNDSGLVHQQIVVDEDPCSPQIEGISPEIVQFVNVNSVAFVADELELPFPLIPFIRHSMDQPPHSLSLTRLQILP